MWCQSVCRFKRLPVTDSVETKFAPGPPHLLRANAKQPRLPSSLDTPHTHTCPSPALFQLSHRSLECLRSATIPQLLSVSMDLDGAESPWGGKHARVAGSAIHRDTDSSLHADEPSRSPGAAHNGDNLYNLVPLSNLLTICLPGSSTESAPSRPAQDSLTPAQSARRGPKTPRKVNAQVTKLEAVDDTTDPLGPLGESSFVEEAPAPPLKEPAASGRAVRPSSDLSRTSSGAGLMDSVNLDDEQPRLKNPPPVQPSSAESPKRQTQPSISVEQAAKPTFTITVGDPHKVGDLTSSHIVYQVRTKVNRSRQKWKTRI
jgi:hypothetical protein